MGQMIGVKEVEASVIQPLKGVTVGKVRSNETRGAEIPRWLKQHQTSMFKGGKDFCLNQQQSQQLQ